MTIIEHYPIANRVVDLSVATAVTDGAVTTVQVKLKSYGALSGTATDFVTNNSLEQEILSKGGLEESATLGTGVIASTVTEGPYYIYTIDYPVS